MKVWLKICFSLFVLAAFSLQVSLPYARWSPMEGGSTRVLDTATGRVVFSIDTTEAAGTFAVALAAGNRGYVLIGPAARMTAMPQQSVRGDDHRQSVVMALAAMTRPGDAAGSKEYMVPQNEVHDHYPGWTRGRGT